MITLSELQVKEVIVISDGKRLGNISDLEIDGDSGKITALIILIRDKASGLFAKSGELVIPWHHIEVIGSDVILIRDVETPSLYSNQQFME